MMSFLEMAKTMTTCYSGHGLWNTRDATMRLSQRSRNFVYSNPLRPLFICGSMVALKCRSADSLA